MNDTLFLSGSDDGKVRLWNKLKPDEIVHTFDGHSKEVTFIAKIDFDQFISASADGTIVLWSLSTTSWVRTFACEGRDTSVASMGGDMFVSGDESNEILQIWTLSPQEQTRPIHSIKYDRHILSVAAVDDSTVVSSHNDGTINILRLMESGLERTTIQTGVKPVYYVAAVSAERFLSGSNFPQKLWSLKYMHFAPVTESMSQGNHDEEEEAAAHEARSESSLESMTQGNHDEKEEAAADKARSEWSLESMAQGNHGEDEEAADKERYETAHENMTQGNHGEDEEPADEERFESSIGSMHGNHGEGDEVADEV